MARDVAWVGGLDRGRLALLARPRAGEWLDDDIGRWAVWGITTVVSLLEPGESTELGLVREASVCEHHGVGFVSFPVPDRGLPASLAAVRALVENLHARLQGGETIAIHCRAGIGRTGLLAGCLLVRCGVPFRDVFPRLSRDRGVDMPDTPTQAAWVARFGESLA